MFWHRSLVRSQSGPLDFFPVIRLPNIALMIIEIQFIESESKVNRLQTELHQTDKQRLLRALIWPGVTTRHLITRLLTGFTGR